MTSYIIAGASDNDLTTKVKIIICLKELMLFLNVILV